MKTLLENKQHPMTSSNIENHLQQQLYYVYYFDMWFVHLKNKIKLLTIPKDSVGPKKCIH